MHLLHATQRAYDVASGRVCREVRACESTPSLVVPVPTSITMGVRRDEYSMQALQRDVCLPPGRHIAPMGLGRRHRRAVDVYSHVRTRFRASPPTAALSKEEW